MNATDVSLRKRFDPGVPKCNDSLKPSELEDELFLL